MESIIKTVVYMKLLAFCDVFIVILHYFIIYFSLVTIGLVTYIKREIVEGNESKVLFFSKGSDKTGGSGQAKAE